MTEPRAPRGNEWNDVIEVLQRLGNMVVIRGHYAEGHPAIAQADDAAAAGYLRILGNIPEIVVALIDGEFVICERPMPELRARIHVLADAMVRHEIECIVFQQGMTRAECAVLGRALAVSADEPGTVREMAQSELQHVLLRFAEIRKNDANRRGVQDAWYLVPQVGEMLAGVAQAIAREDPIERLTVQALANQILHYVKARTFALHQRPHTRTFEDSATHATNVAFMTAAVALECGYPAPVCVDVTAGALLHDLGHLLLPEAIRGVPEPLLEEAAKPVFRNHTFLGASALLVQGCPPLWVAIALEHHRGVDGGGYPKLEASAPPHELARIVALANYYDRKRTSIGPRERAQEPDTVLLRALALEERFFGGGLVRAFLRALGVFPPGTVVELSNREPAIVTQPNGADPWRPQVKMLRGPQLGKRVELKELNPVEGRHELSVIGAIAPPLLVLADVIAPVEREPATPAAERGAAPEAQALLATAAEREAGKTSKTSEEVARHELAHMGGLLDDLLALSGGALLSQPPGSAPMPPLPTSSWPPAPTPASSVRPGFTLPPTITNAPPAPKPAQPRVITQPPASIRARKPLPRSEEPSPTSVPVLADPSADLVRLGIDHRTAFILTFVDGVSTVEDIVDASGQPKADVFALLTELAERGVISLR
jgi:HD-GYP domain-containing protein (c-di-GMP phosphodiesterase class II)